MKKFLFPALFIFGISAINAQSLSGKHHIKYLEINTVQSDYGATYLAEDKVVFTTPADDRSKNSQLDLFVGDVGNEGEIVNKERVKGFIGKKVSKTGITYSQDKQTVYFSAKPYRRRARAKDKNQLFSAHVETSGQWTNITKLSFNSKNHSFEHPSLTKDGKKLYFVSDMPGTIGGKDIFVVNIAEDGSYGQPSNLGPKINTRKDEVTPYITEKNILYFSSNGHEEGMGSLDVYASEVFDNTVSDPLHLESPVNSINDDFAYIVNSKNDRGYFSSNRLQGQSNNDIYAFTIEEPAPEKCLQEITGVVRDKETQEILRNAAITLFDNDGNQIQQVVTDEDGAYKLSLDCSSTFTLVAASLHYNKEEHVVNTANYPNAPTLEANKFLTRNAEEATEVVEENTIEEAATLNAIYFDFDKSNIRVDATSELDKIAEIMKENPSVQVEVSSFTDARGSSDYNMKLSNRRAKSTIDYLVSKGIERKRLKGKGYGETRMLNKCINGVECSESAHAVNRRTEFAILNTQAFTAPDPKKASIRSKVEQPQQGDKTSLPESAVAENSQAGELQPESGNKMVLSEIDETGSETEKKEGIFIVDSETETALIAETGEEKGSDPDNIEPVNENGLDKTGEVKLGKSASELVEMPKTDKSSVSEVAVNEIKELTMVKATEQESNIEENPQRSEQVQEEVPNLNEGQISKAGTVQEGNTNNESAQAAETSAMPFKKKNQQVEPIDIKPVADGYPESEEEDEGSAIMTFNRDLSEAEDNISSFSNKLDPENSSLKSKAGETAPEPQEQKFVVPAKIEKNIPIKTSTVNVSAMSIKANGNYVETGRAARTDAIKVEFKMYNNEQISPGNKEIFIVIENPMRKVINERGRFTTRNGQEIAFSDETVAFYDNNGLSISILSDRFIQKIIKGTYVVKIYIERYLTGQTFLILS